VVVKERGKEQVIDLLTRKDKYIKEFLKLTESAIFKNLPEDAETYSNLIIKRDKVLNEIKTLDINLEKYNYQDFLVDDDKQINQLINNIKINCKKIIEKDMGINHIIEPIYFNIKHKIKEINQGKNLNSAYRNYSAMETVSGFDKKN
jgi:hypothetical protein